MRILHYCWVYVENIKSVPHTDRPLKQSLKKNAQWSGLGVQNLGYLNYSYSVV